MYADFLDEAALLLNKPDLKAAASQFRAAARAWNALAESLLPEEVLLLKETRNLKRRKHRLFIEEGSAALEELRTINTRLAEIKTLVAAEFPLNPAEVAALRENWREQILKIRDLEREAVTMMQRAM
ncbi:MAG TPA: DUF4872 domain-containing protein [Phototrophicaceae bacterium]|nr:DUF4872 domain-containing protein [Phototrophicaceae bacterium]